MNKPFHYLATLTKKGHKTLYITCKTTQELNNATLYAHSLNYTITIEPINPTDS